MSSRRKLKSSTDKRKVIDKAVKCGPYMTLHLTNYDKLDDDVRKFIKDHYKCRANRTRIGGMYMDNARLHIDTQSIGGNTDIENYWLTAPSITYYFIGIDKDDEDNLTMDIDRMDINPREGDYVMFIVKVRGRGKICSTCWMFNEIFVIQLMMTAEGLGMLKIITHSIGVPVKLD